MPRSGVRRRRSWSRRWSPPVRGPPAAPHPRPARHPRSPRARPRGHRPTPRAWCRASPRPPPPPRRRSRRMAGPPARCGRTRSGSSRSGSRPGRSRWARTRPRSRSWRRQSPPDWVASEFPSEQPEHEVTLTKGFWIDRNEVSNTAFAAFRRRRRLHEPGALVGRRLDVAGWSRRGPPAAPLQRRRSRPTADVHHLVRGRGVRRLARRPPPDRGRVGVRRARARSRRSTRGATRSTASGRTSSTASPRSRSAAIRPAPAGSARWTWPATRWSGSPTGSTPATTRRARRPIRPARRPATVKVEKGGWWGSNEFVARSAYRHYEDPPTYGDKHIGFRVASQ